MISLTNKATFETAIAEIIEVPNLSPEEFKHPFLTIAKFVLADDKPNANKQGIEYADFDDVARSAIDMPVKMNFSKRSGLKNHMGSIPIGHIKSTEYAVTDDGINQLIASAVLWSDEYPDEITYLKESHASGKPAKISYEMAYADSVTKEDTQWLKKPITLAATFVDNPAYGSRTSLIALASAGEISMTELAKELILLAKAEEINPREKGGNNVDEKELKALQDRLAEAEKELGTLRTEASTKTETITTLEGQLGQKDEAIKALTDQNSALVKAQLIDTRVRKLGEVGIVLEADAEKAAKKKEFWASLSDEAFEEYVSDLQAAKKASQAPNRIALASVNTEMPRPTLDGANDITPKNLLTAIKSL